MFDPPSFGQHERVVSRTMLPPAYAPSRLPTAEDVGASVADMEIVAGQTRYVSGLPRTAVTSDGNPSPKTAVRLTEIFARSSATHRPASELADEMARQLLVEAR